jgi:predicted TIM-barrel fold metal-dependent hydrolase
MSGRIIDVHTHIYTEQAYQEYLRKAKGLVEKAITIQYWTGTGRPKYELAYLLEFVSDKNLELIAALNSNFPIDQQLDVLEQERDAIVGVKMYPGYEHFYPSDEMVWPVAEFCQRRGKVLMFHSGDVSARGIPLLKHAVPIHIDGLAVKFPECRIIIAHFGFPYFLETATVLNKNKNVYTDISGTIDRLPNEAARNRLIKRYADDLSRVVDYYPEIPAKILFGTDYSGEHSHLNEFAPYLTVVNKAFSTGAARSIFHENAQELF